jgi:uncharacterized protein YndB with AHSA1/START domain
MTMMQNSTTVRSISSPGESTGLPPRFQCALIAGSAEEVWSLITDPRHFQTWHAFGGAEIELRPGGAMTLRWDEHGAFEAVVESVIPGRLFSFRWKPEPGDPLTT